MDMQLVIKLTSGDGTGVPVGLVESPPMLYTNLKDLFPTITFSDVATPSEVEPYWYGVFEWNYAPTDVPYNKNVLALGLVKNSQGIWRPEFELVDASAEEIAERTASQALLVRNARNGKLKNSDWVDLPRFNETMHPELKKKYDEYRQALRDLPTQSGFPFDVIMPIRPDKEE